MLCASLSLDEPAGHLDSRRQLPVQRIGVTVPAHVSHDGTAWEETVAENRRAIQSSTGVADSQGKKQQEGGETARVSPWARI